MSIVDYKSIRLAKTQALKQLREIVNTDGVIHISSHAKSALNDDNLSSVDALNVLKSPDARIETEGEYEKGAFRYQLRTNQITLVIAFQEDGKSLVVITAWRHKGKK